MGLQAAQTRIFFLYNTSTFLSLVGYLLLRDSLSKSREKGRKEGRKEETLAFPFRLSRQLFPLLIPYTGRIIRLGFPEIYENCTDWCYFSDFVLFLSFWMND